MDNDDHNLSEEKKKLLESFCRARGGECELRDTHMSWLFLGVDHVYKLKKPVRYAFLDFSSPEKRHYFCLEELQLNRRLAKNTYLSVIPLSRNTDASLRIGGDEQKAIDWIVEMRRLADCDMLDHRMHAGQVGYADIDALAGLLSHFYQSLPPEPVEAEQQLAYICERLDTDAAVLRREEFNLAASVAPLLTIARKELKECTLELQQRISSGRFREGHGDLRPEHIWLGQPIQIIDCLEFNRRMRIVDPFEDIAQLGLECALAGYPWIAGILREKLAADLGGEPTPRLTRFYIASKALLRARLCMQHLMEKQLPTPSKWPPLAQKYLNIASKNL